MARVILSFQAPNGGWSKHVDFSLHARQPGESYFAESADWEWISTIDNDATTEEIRFLARADSARHDARYGQAIVRAVDYLLVSQFPNGCFPQIYPLQGSYHDAVDVQRQRDGERAPAVAGRRRRPVRRRDARSTHASARRAGRRRGVHRRRAVSGRRDD